MRPSRAFLASLALVASAASYACASGVEDEANPDTPGTQTGDGGVTVGQGDGGKPEGGGSVTPGPCSAKVVINEVMTQGDAPEEEFIELYNPGDCTVDLAGYKLQYKSAAGASGGVIHEFESGDTIAKGAFLVLGTRLFTGAKDITVTGTTGMAKDSGSVGLEDGGGTLVDAVGYGTAKGDFVEGTPARTPPANGSISRKVDGEDTDDNAADFRTSADPTPGAPNS